MIQKLPKIRKISETVIPEKVAIQTTLMGHIKLLESESNQLARLFLLDKLESLKTETQAITTWPLTSGRV